jgi:ribosomal protein S18 acetylase RimI-like enzyme
MKMKIRRCNHSDLEQLREIGIKIFQDTFGAQSSAEDMKEYLETAFHPSKLEKELENKLSEFYFLYFGNECAGYLKINTGDAQSEDMGDETLEIERLYISAEYQGKGLGKFLINEAIKFAQEKGKRKVWLGVWENNEKAIAFYKKSGFVLTGEHTFYVGSDAQTDLIMTKVLF